MNTSNRVPEHSNKEDYEQKKAEKEAARKKEEQKRAWKRQVRRMLVLLFFLIAAGGVFAFLAQPQNLPEDQSRTMPSEGQTHVPEGQDVSYNSNPPTSGSHWPIPLKDGVYDKEKPDEAVVHSMEHGRVWISYKPSISEEAKKKLEEFADGQGAVILTPRSENESDIALAVWGRLDTFNLSEDGSLDLDRVKAFVRRWRNKGPESVPIGSGGGKEY